MTFLPHLCEWAPEKFGFSDCWDATPPKMLWFCVDGFYSLYLGLEGYLHRELDLPCREEGGHEHFLNILLVEMDTALGCCWYGLLCTVGVSQIIRATVSCNHGLVSNSCSARDAGDTSSVSGWRRSPGEGNDSPLQYSCWDNPMGRGAWRATVHEGCRVGHNWAWDCLVLWDKIGVFLYHWSA